MYFEILVKQKAVMIEEVLDFEKGNKQTFIYY